MPLRSFFSQRVRRPYLWPNFFGPHVHKGRHQDTLDLFCTLGKKLMQCRVQTDMIKLQRIESKGILTSLPMASCLSEIRWNFSLLLGQQTKLILFNLDNVGRVKSTWLAWMCSPPLSSWHCLRPTVCCWCWYILQPTALHPLSIPHSDLIHSSLPSI